MEDEAKERVIGHVPRHAHRDRPLVVDLTTLSGKGTAAEEGLEVYSHHDRAGRGPIDDALWVDRQLTHGNPWTSRRRRDPGSASRPASRSVSDSCRPVDSAPGNAVPLTGVPARCCCVIRAKKASARRARSGSRGGSWSLPSPVDLPALRKQSVAFPRWERTWAARSLGWDRVLPRR